MGHTQLLSASTSPHRRERLLRLGALRAAAGVATATILGLTVFCASSAAAGVTAACTARPYAYAGLVANAYRPGIKATIAATKPADVKNGHVAGWIGVGGPKAGPNGTAEWLQAGLNVVADGSAEIYSEQTTPGQSPVYTTLGKVVVGKAYRIAVVEISDRPGTWHVLLNGKVVSPPVSLPGSHDAFQPMAMTESWNGNVPSCNDFSYRFAGVMVGGNGSWTGLTAGSAQTLSDLGYRVAMTDAGFVAGRSV